MEKKQKKGILEKIVVWARDTMAQCLPGKREVVSSIPSILSLPKKRKKKWWKQKFNRKIYTK